MILIFGKNYYNLENVCKRSGETVETRKRTVQSTEDGGDPVSKKSKITTGSSGSFIIKGK